MTYRVGGDTLGTVKETKPKRGEGMDSELLRLAQGTKFKAVDFGGTGTTHFIGPSGGLTLCGRLPHGEIKRIASGTITPCKVCRRALEARLFVAAPEE